MARPCVTRPWRRRVGDLVSNWTSSPTDVAGSSLRERGPSASSGMTRLRRRRASRAPRPRRHHFFGASSRVRQVEERELQGGFAPGAGGAGPSQGALFRTPRPGAGGLLHGQRDWTLIWMPTSPSRDAAGRHPGRARRAAAVPVHQGTAAAEWEDVLPAIVEFG